MTTLTEMLQIKEKQQLESAIEWAGSPQMLAKFLNVSPQVVNNWTSRGRISATAAALLELKTSGKFKKSEMRPDVKEWYL